MQTRIFFKYRNIKIGKQLILEAQIGNKYFESKVTLDISLFGFSTFPNLDVFSIIFFDKVDAFDLIRKQNCLK